MSTTTAPQPIPRQPLALGTLRRLAALALIATGTVVAVAGVALAAALGTDGELRSGRHSLATPAAALVSPVAGISNTDGVTRAVGRAQIGLAASSRPGGHGVFVGVGPAAAVDRYLKGASVDTARSIDLKPWHLAHDVRPGADAPTPPAEQRFWVAQASGTSSAALRWRIRDGDFRLVVMNADASRGLRADGSVSVLVPHLATLAVAAGLVGMLAAAGGAFLLFAVRRRPDAGARAA